MLLNWLSVVTMISFFTPLLILLGRKLAKDPFFLPFALYWAFSGLVEAIDFLPHINIPLPVQRTIGAVYNMLDIPFALAILYYTTNSLQIKKFAGVSLICFLLLELASVIKTGVNYGALKYTMGTGLGLALVIVSWEIVRYLRQVEHNNRQNAKVLVYAAILFEYASFIVVYGFDYFTTDAFHDTVREDIYLVYYISTLIAIVIACSGFFLYRKYIREEPIRNEIKIDII